MFFSDPESGQAKCSCPLAKLEALIVYSTSELWVLLARNPIDAVARMVSGVRLEPLLYIVMTEKGGADIELRSDSISAIKVPSVITYPEMSILIECRQVLRLSSFSRMYPMR